MRLGCVGGKRDRPSQRSGFGEDPLPRVRAETAVCQDFDGTSQEFFEILFERDHVE
jgi:hypothetical protein